MREPRISPSPSVMISPSSRRLFATYYSVPSLSVVARRSYFPAGRPSGNPQELAGAVGARCRPTSRSAPESQVLQPLYEWHRRFHAIHDRAGNPRLSPEVATVRPRGKRPHKKRLQGAFLPAISSPKTAPNRTYRQELLERRFLSAAGFHWMIFYAARKSYLIFFIQARIGPETVLSGVSIENTIDMWLSPLA